MRFFMSFVQWRSGNELNIPGYFFEDTVSSLFDISFAKSFAKRFTVDLSEYLTQFTRGNTSFVPSLKKMESKNISEARHSMSFSTKEKKVNFSLHSFLAMSRRLDPSAVYKPCFNLPRFDREQIIHCEHFRIPRIKASSGKLLKKQHESF